MRVGAGPLGPGRLPTPCGFRASALPPPAPRASLCVGPHCDHFPLRPCARGSPCTPSRATAPPSIGTLPLLRWPGSQWVPFHTEPCQSDPPPLRPSPLARLPEETLPHRALPLRPPPLSLSPFLWWAESQRESCHCDPSHLAPSASWSVGMLPLRPGGVGRAALRDVPAEAPLGCLPLGPLALWCLPLGPLALWCYALGTLAAARGNFRHKSSSRTRTLGLRLCKSLPFLTKL